MSMSAEHKALVFVGTVALLGAAVRVVRAVGGAAPPGAQPALERQIAASDSAKHAKKQKSGRKARRPSHVNPDSETPSSVVSKRAPRGSGPLDRPGYINGKLDLDVATAPQVDSLAGVTSAMAKRIVADRLERGPFLSIDGLRRVPGAGPKFIERIDSAVVFSGTLKHPSADDTIIPRRARVKRTGTSSARPATPPAERRTPVPR